MNTADTAIDSSISPRRRRAEPSTEARRLDVVLRAERPPVADEEAGDHEEAPEQVEPERDAPGSRSRRAAGRTAGRAARRRRRSHRAAPRSGRAAASRTVPVDAPGSGPDSAISFSLRTVLHPRCRAQPGTPALQPTATVGCCRISSTVIGQRSSGKWQATSCARLADRCELRLVDVAACPRRTRGQRGWKRQPSGGLIGLGTSPSSTICLRSRPSCGFAIGTAESSAAGVRVLRGLVELLPGPDLDDLAEVHHHHPVGDVPDDVEVVRDEDVGEPELLLEIRRAG